MFLNGRTHVPCSKRFGGSLSRSRPCLLTALTLAFVGQISVGSASSAREQRLAKGKRSHETSLERKLYEELQKLREHCAQHCGHLCGNLLRRVRADLVVSSSTPSTRRLLDGVAIPVPRRSTEP